jgi:hypothetical protein
MEKNEWRKNWLNSIYEITSLELQEKTWLDNENTNPHWSFIEFMCFYFDDLSLSKNYEEELKSGWVKEDEYLILKDWHDKLNNYNSPKNLDINDQVLSDINWLEIISIGTKAKSELYKIVSQEEKNYLNSLV